MNTLRRRPSPESAFYVRRRSFNQDGTHVVGGSHRVSDDLVLEIERSLGHGDRSILQITSVVARSGVQIKQLAKLLLAVNDTVVSTQN